jgi:lysophospholipase L1-like esterase
MRNAFSLRRHQDSLIARVVLLVIVVLLTLGAFELFLRAQVPPPFVTVFQTSQIEGLPYQHRPHASALYFGNLVEINSHGFRGPEVGAKKQGLRRIALIGDSITFGHVPYDETLAVCLTANLRQRGDQSEVVNCGVSGYSASHIAVMLERQVLDLSPDAIVYVFCDNDAPLRGPTVPDKISPDHVIDLKNTFFMHSAFLELSGQSAKALLRAIGIQPNSGYVAEQLENWRNGGAERLRVALKKMRDLSIARGVPFYVVSTPPMAHPGRNPFAEIERGIEDAAAQLSIPFLDLRQAFPPGENLGRYRVSVFDSHPNGEANKRMAALMAEWIQSLPGGRVD